MNYADHNAERQGIDKPQPARVPPTPYYDPVAVTIRRSIAAAKVAARHGITVEESELPEVWPPELPAVAQEGLQLA